MTINLSSYYAVQGLRDNKWVTLFAPYLTALDVAAKTNELAKANPACRYRWVRIADGITYV